MTYAEYLAEKDWICNNPTEEEIRFNDDCDLISSEDSGEGTSNTECIRYNQLLPNGKLVHKLLHSTKPKFNISWRAPGCKLDFQKNHIEGSTRFDRSYTSSSDSDTAFSISPKTHSKSSCEVKKRLENSAEVVYVEESYRESELESVSSRKMAKSHKRKREDSASSEEESCRSKKIKSNENQFSKKIKRKEKNHDLSFSEDSDRHSIVSSKGHSVKKSNRNSLNTHLLSSESDNEEKDFSSVRAASSVVTSKYSYSANGKASDSSERELSPSSVEGSNPVDETVTTTTSSMFESRKPLYRIPKFTQELNDEISKFSLLLEENLVKKNDIWVLQCPSNMDCSALVSQRLNLGGSCKLNDRERTYEAYSYCNDNTRSATLAVPSEGNRLDLRRIPIVGNIIVEESVKSASKTRYNSIISEPPSRVEFPENLRLRHPLLGIDFSKQPRTVERIAQSVLKKKRRSKKHNESHIDHVELEEESIDGSAKKKKKKKKHKDNNSFS